MNRSNRVPKPMASLATVTNRFNCSASMGNLWHHNHLHQNHYTTKSCTNNSNSNNNNSSSKSELASGELADDSMTNIRALDYVACATFDSYHPDDEQQSKLSYASSSANSSALLVNGAAAAAVDAREPIITSKSASSNQLLSVSSCGSTRKLSSKSDKCKRHKEAERVEKLRMLVNYLRSGSTQPVVVTPTLEHHEIELAERYKSHLILRDDLFCDATTHPNNGLTNGTTNSSTGSNNNNNNSIAALASNNNNCININYNTTVNGNSNNNAEHKITDELLLSSPKSSIIISRSKKNSIDGTTPSSSSSFSSSSMNHAHSTHDDRSLGNVTLRHSISDPGSNLKHLPAFSSASSQHLSTNNNNNSNHHHHSALSQQHLGSTTDHLHHHPNTDVVLTNSTPNPSQSLKLFYIEDIDPVSSAVPIGSTPLQHAGTSTSSSPLLLSPQSHQQQHLHTPALTPVASADLPTSRYSSYSKNTGCGDFNLATWVESEVNSLVHDLEILSKSETKQSKSSKRKWLSVASGNVLRHSSSSGTSST